MVGLGVFVGFGFFLGLGVGIGVDVNEISSGVLTLDLSVWGVVCMLLSV